MRWTTDRANVFSGTGATLLSGDLGVNTTNEGFIVTVINATGNLTGIIAFTPNAVSSGLNVTCALPGAASQTRELVVTNASKCKADN